MITELFGFGAPLGGIACFIPGILRRRRQDAALAALPPPPLPQRTPRPALPAEDREAARPELSAWERQQVRDLEDGMLAWAGPSAMSHGESLADGLRKGLPDFTDADLARVLLKVHWFATITREEQGDAELAAMVLCDALAVAPVLLASLDLELTTGGGMP